MADRKNYFYKQTVTEAELDAGFNDFEVAERALISDQALNGIMQGASVTEAGAPGLTVEVTGPAVIYDQLGQRLFWSPTQIVDCSFDEGGNPTAVVGGGNARVLSVFAEFDRTLSDPRVDGNGDTVYFLRDESFKFNVVAGATAAAGAEVAPVLRVDQILLCDITLSTAQVTILNADIDLVTRREDVFVLTGAPNNERGGTPNGILQSFQDQINSFIVGGGGAIAYGGGGNWADGTTNPATTIEGQFDKIITDLATGAGAAKIQTAAGPAWADGTLNPAEQLDQRVDSIISDLGSGAGSAKILTAAGPAWHDATANPAEQLDQRIDSIVSDLVANNGADRIGVLASAGGVITGGGSVMDALNELEVLAQQNETDVAAADPGLFTHHFAFHRVVEPGATAQLQVSVAAIGDRFQQVLSPLPQGKRVSGAVFYGKHALGGGTAAIRIYKQQWGSTGGDIVGAEFTTTGGVGNIVGSGSWAPVTIDGGNLWFIRVTNNSAGLLTLYALDLSIVA